MMKISFSPNINARKPILIEIGDKKFRTDQLGLSAIQDQIDKVYSQQVEYMEHSLGLNPASFIKKPVHYKCPYCQAKIGGIGQNGDCHIDTKCVKCGKDLMSKMIEITAQPFMGL